MQEPNSQTEQQQQQQLENQQPLSTQPNVEVIAAPEQMQTQDFLVPKSPDNFSFLYNDRLYRMGLQGIEDILIPLLNSGPEVERFNLPALVVDVEPLNPNNKNKLIVEVQNFVRGKKEETADKFYLGGPIRATLITPDGARIKAEFPVINQQPLDTLSMSNALLGRTPYQRISGSWGPEDKMYIKSSENVGDDFVAVKVYNGNIKALRDAWNKKADEMKLSSYRRDFVADRLIKGDKIGFDQLNKATNQKETIWISASRSSDLNVTNDLGRPLTTRKTVLASEFEAELQAKTQSNTNTPPAPSTTVPPDISQIAEQGVTSGQTVPAAATVTEQPTKEIDTGKNIENPGTSQQIPPATNKQEIDKAAEVLNQVSTIEPPTNKGKNKTR